jgi:hypothetical protein
MRVGFFEVSEDVRKSMMDVGKGRETSTEIRTGIS